MRDVRPSERPWLDNGVRRPGLSLNEAGLIVGATFVLAHLSKRQALEIQPERVLALLSVGYRRPIAFNVLDHIEAASSHWMRGDKALANFRLLFAGLPHLDQPSDVPRLRLAEWLLDEGLSPHDLMAQLDIETSALDVRTYRDVRKYDANQPRVPAGNGTESGRWASIWQGIGDWLDEAVPEYDQDTGTQVGTRTRGRAIATNPLTIIGAGAAALFVGEAVLAGGAAAGEAALADGAGAAVLPVGPAAAVDASSTAALEQTGIAANNARGLASEARVLKELGYLKNTKMIASSEGRSIPDALTSAYLIEIKDVAYITNTVQLRIQAEAARLLGIKPILITGERTRISKTVLKLFEDIWRRQDLGPK